MTQQQMNECAMYVAPTLGVDGRTVVCDRCSKRPVLWMRGVVILPIGATIEFVAPKVSARVVGVRLQSADASEVQVCLDVDLPDEYWATADEDLAAADERLLQECLEGGVILPAI